VAAACNGNPGGPQTGVLTVTAITPSTGTTFGGTSVTITGTGFESGATVTIGGVAATNVLVASATRMTATTPAHATGIAEVRVAVGSQSASLTNGFTFTAPATSPNLAPVVSDITVQPPRPDQPKTMASTGDRMSLTVSVNDAETAANQLIYEWAAIPALGTFSGTGPAVQWTAPATLTSARIVVLSLTVVERYQEAGADGLPVQREHRVQRTAAMKVHDTEREVGDMAVDFLTLFSNSSIANPDVVLHNFSRTCDGGAGYNDEKGDVEISRRDWVITNFKVTPPTKFEYEFGADNACSGTQKRTAGDFCVEVPMEWSNRCATGSQAAECKAVPTFTNTVRGIDYVSAVYESSQWRLCHSRWEAFDTLTGRPVIMDFDHRGKIIKGPQDK
jgi:hypothetical protein